MDKENAHFMAAPAAKPELSCATCSAWSAYPDEQQKGRPIAAGRCHLDAPKTHVVLVPVRALQGDALSATVITAWPETTEADYCFSHFTDDEPAAAESQQ